MGLLFRNEMKKLFRRRMVWVFLALGMVLSAASYYEIVAKALGGHVAALKDVYAQYDGQIVTDELLEQAHREYLQYAADHPDEFNESGYDVNGGTTYYAWNLRTYGAGWESAYDYISRYASETIEMRRNRANLYSQLLKDGYNIRGQAITEDERKRYEDYLLVYDEPQIIQNPGGWFDLILAPGSGLAFLLLAITALGPLFSGEGPARMESLVLTAVQRRQAVMAKLLAAGCCALLFFVACYGPKLLVTALTYGFPHPATLSMQMFTGSSWQDIPVYQALLWMEALHLTAALSCTALIVLCSAAPRRPLSTLAAAAAVIGIQVLIHSIASDSIIVSDQMGIAYSEILPANVLLYSTQLAQYIMGRARDMLYAVIIAISSAILLTALAPRCWLKQRKA